MSEKIPEPTEPEKIEGQKSFYTGIFVDAHKTEEERQRAITPEILARIEDLKKQYNVARESTDYMQNVVERARIGQELDMLQGFVLTTDTVHGRVDMRPVYDNGMRRFEILIDRSFARRDLSEKEKMAEYDAFRWEEQEERGRDQESQKSVAEKMAKELEQKSIIILEEIFDLDENPYTEDTVNEARKIHAEVVRNFRELGSFWTAEVSAQSGAKNAEKILLREHPDLDESLR